MTLPTTKQSRATQQITPLQARVMLAGTPKAGKSTLAGGWAPDKTLIIDTQGGTKLLDGEHYVQHVSDWPAFAETVDDLAAGGHQFEVVVIDLIDDVWKFVDAHVGEARKAPGGLASAKDDYQKAIGEAEGTFRQAIGKLFASPLGVWFISHTKTTTENGINRHVPKLDSRVYTYVAGACDFILLAEKLGPKHVLHTQSSARFEAGGRVTLPEPMDLDARKLYGAMARGLGSSKPKAVEPTPEPEQPAETEINEQPVEVAA